MLVSLWRMLLANMICPLLFSSRGKDFLGSERVVAYFRGVQQISELYRLLNEPKVQVKIAT